MTTASKSRLDWLRQEIYEWLDELFGDREPARIRDYKIVEDPVHGFIRLRPYEVAILDSPILQRLRFIHQADLAFLVYPGMRHTRFEHSLGTFHVAGRMTEALRLKADAGVTEENIAIVRLAALLHDVGHTFLSHLGEGLLKDRFRVEFSELKQAEVDGIPRLFRDSSESEMIAYIIITSPLFEKFVNAAVTKNQSSSSGFNPAELDVYKIGRLIIRRSSNPEDDYMVGIVNGSVDADKLDYLLRDCHYSGIRAEVDIERLINTLSVVIADGWPRALTVDAVAVHHIEQILLAKLTLFSSLYHHHKVRGIECLVKAMYEQIIKRPLDIKRPQLRLEKVSDFLRLDDMTFLAFAGEEPLLSSLIDRIRKRDLLKRVLTISRASVTGPTQYVLIHLLSLSTSRTEQQRVRQEIYEALPADAKTDLGLFWVDIPTPPEVDREATQFFVQTGGKEPVTLKDILPTPEWLRTYAANKARSHIFYVADDCKRVKAADVAEEYFKANYGLEFTNFSRLASRLPAL